MSGSEINISAPGKVILHGEHAVVYGKAAIAANLNLRCKLQLVLTDNASVRIDLQEIGIKKLWSIKDLENGLRNLQTAGSVTNPTPASEEAIVTIKDFLGIDADCKDPKQLALISFLYMYTSIFRDKGKLPSISISIKSELPVGAGLGSSAAFSVSMAAALLQTGSCISSEKLDATCAGWRREEREIINKWAFVGEKLIHGQPSGIDNSISTFGGALRFQNRQMSPIDKMPSVSVMLVNTRVPRSTMVLVGNVRKSYNKYQKVFDHVLDAIEAISEESELVYSKLYDSPGDEDYSKLGDLMDYNHQLLNFLGVGHPSLDQIVSVAAKHGLHAKLTGAGGGGCAFILIPPGTPDSLLDTVKEELENCGYEVWRKTTVGGHGVLQSL